MVVRTRLEKESEGQVWKSKIKYFYDPKETQNPLRIVIVGNFITMKKIDAVRTLGEISSLFQEVAKDRELSRVSLEKDSEAVRKKSYGLRITKVPS